jgi:hypothetical protein
MTPFPSEFLHGYSGCPPLTGPLPEGFTYDRGAIGTAEPGIQPQTLMAFRLSDHVATRCVFRSPPCDPIETVGILPALTRNWDRVTNRTPGWITSTGGFSFGRSFFLGTNVRPWARSKRDNELRQPHVQKAMDRGESEKAGGFGTAE